MWVLMFAAFLWSGVGITSTDILNHSRPLHAGLTERLDVPGFSFEGQALCDRLGNFYTRPTVGFEDTAIIKISHDGSKQSVYRLLDADMSAESISFVGFNITPAGDLWEMLQSPDGSRIQVFQFGEEQEARHRTTLQVPKWVHPQKFAVFPENTVFFTGYYDAKAGTQFEGKTFSALLDSSGRLIQTINNQAVDYLFDVKKLPEGMVVRGDDNKIYVLQSDRVLVYSVTGEFVHQMKFEKPETDLRVTRLDVSDGLLSIEFAKPFEKKTPRGTIHSIAKTYLVLNAEDSRIVSYYLPDEEVGNNCVCFDRKQGYTFFWIENGFVKLVHAPLK